MDPNGQSVHVNTPLTNISIAFLQNQSHFIADKVFPNVPVNHRSDRYYTYDQGDFNRDQAQKRAPSTETAGGGYDVDNTPNYFCDVYGIHKDIDDQIRSNADAVLSPDMEATNWVTHQLLIKREKLWGTTFFTGGVWDNDIDGVAATPNSTQTIKWSDQTSGDPIGDIRAARTTVLEQTGYMPNTLTIGQQVLDALVDHPDIVDRIKYSGGVGNNTPAVVNLNALAQLFDVDRINVARAIVNSAEKGASASHAFILGKKALLTWSPPTPSLMTPSAGYTFSWRGYMGQTNEFGAAIRRFRLEQIRSDRVEGEMAFDQKVVSSALGYFWDTIVD
jgi:hypothetical protein